MDTAGTLERALQLMEEQGWIQGALANSEGICSSKAIWDAIDKPWLDGGRTEMISAVRAIGAQTGLMNIAIWNDHPDRTFAQVRETFRRAAYTAHKMEVAV